MKYILENILVFLGIFLVSFNLLAKMNNELFSSSIDLLFEDRMDKPGCAIGVIKDGSYIHNKGYGLANLEHNIPIGSHTIFRIGSISKQFTAMLLAILDEKGMLSIDDSINKYIPDLINYGQKVTINQMIHHFSGLGDYEYMDYPGRFKNALGNEFRWGNQDYLTNEEFHNLIKKLPLIREPEEKFHYSNTGYVLLALVAQNVTGLSLRELAQKEIFMPLSMSDSFFNDDVNLIFKNRADAYSKLSNDPASYKINVTNLSWVGDGGVYTSLDDFIKWDQNFYDNKLGKRRSSLIKTMESTYSKTKVEKRNQEMANIEENEKTYAYAQNLSYFNGYKRWSHSGSWVGWLAHYARYPEISFSITVFCNTDELDATIIADEITEIYFKSLNK